MYSSVKAIPTSFPPGSLNTISILLSSVAVVVKALMCKRLRNTHNQTCVHVLWSVSSAGLLLISLTKGNG